MKKLKKFNEFFDTEDIKIEHDIELLSNILNPTNIIKTFDKQDTIYNIGRMLTYKYPFLRETSKHDKNSFLTKSEDGFYNFVFSNVNCTFSMGIRRNDTRSYDLIITYIPAQVTNFRKNHIVLYAKSLDIYYDKAISQIFQNITLDDVYDKMDDILIPIMIEFGFEHLLDQKSDYDIEQN